MCRIPNTNVGIRDLRFNQRGRMSARLNDGREIIVPISMFPDIKRLSVKERGEWMILDDQFFTFRNLSKVYSVQDLLRLA